ncbi:MAG TPA: hypothetical protein V6D20_03570 [Candidatus Obscuribacterales bacterium]
MGHDSNGRSLPGSAVIYQERSPAGTVGAIASLFAGNINDLNCRS